MGSMCNQCAVGYINYPNCTQESPLVIPSEILATQQVISGTTAAISVFSFDISASLHAVRLGSMARSLECHGRSQYVSVDINSHPLGFDIGTESYISTHAGLIVGDLAIIIGVTVIQGLVALKVGAEKVHFPSLSISVLLYFFPHILTSALIVTFYAESTFLYAIGVTALFVAAVTVCMIAYLTTGSRFTATYIPKLPSESDDESQSPNRRRKSKPKLFVAFFTRRRGKWVDSDADTGFCKKFNSLFKDFVAPLQWFLLVELCLSICIAVLDFQIIVSIGHCQTLSGLLFGLHSVYLIILLYFQPLCKPFSKYLTITSTFLLVITALVSFIMNLMDNSLDDNNGSASRGLEQLASICLLLSSCIGFVKTFISGLTRFQTLRKCILKKCCGITEEKSRGTVINRPPTDSSGILDAQQEPLTRDYTAVEMEMIGSPRGRTRVELENRGIPTFYKPPSPRSVGVPTTQGPPETLAGSGGDDAAVEMRMIGSPRGRTRVELENRGIPTFYKPPSPRAVGVPTTQGPPETLAGSISSNSRGDEDHSKPKAVQPIPKGTSTPRGTVEGNIGDAESKHDRDNPLSDFMSHPESPRASLALRPPSPSPSPKSPKVYLEALSPRGVPNGPHIPPPRPPQSLQPPSPKPAEFSIDEADLEFQSPAQKPAEFSIDEADLEFQSPAQKPAEFTFDQADL